MALQLLLGGRQPEALIAGGGLAAAAATSLREYWRGARYGRGGFARLLLRHRRRYAAYLAHLAIVIVAAGIAASQLGHREAQLALKAGGRATVAGHSVVYLGAGSTRLDHGHVQTTASVLVDGSPMAPGRVSYPDFGGQSDALVAIRPSLLGDVYVVLGSVAPDGTAALLVAVNPLVDWIWAGAALLIAAILLGNVRAPARAPLPQPARQAAVVPA
jgi:cytochrome c-type biogenesis protein CcmF